MKELDSDGQDECQRHDTGDAEESEVHSKLSGTPDELFLSVLHLEGHDADDSCLGKVGKREERQIVIVARLGSDARDRNVGC